MCEAVVGMKRIPLFEKLIVFHLVKTTMPVNQSDLQYYCQKIVDLNKNQISVSENEKYHLNIGIIHSYSTCRIVTGNDCWLGADKLINNYLRF